MKKQQVKNQNVYHVTFNYNVVAHHHVDSVLVLGDFNEWSMENAYHLKQNKKGDFEGKFKIPGGRNYHFRYLVNGKEWRNEKDADWFEASPLLPHIDNSVLSLPGIDVEVSVDSVKKEVSRKPVKKVIEEVSQPAKKSVKKNDIVTKKGSTKKVKATKEKPEKKTSSKKIVKNK